jgi:hypothetical protein
MLVGTPALSLLIVLSIDIKGVGPTILCSPEPLYSIATEDLVDVPGGLGGGGKNGGILLSCYIISNITNYI